MKPNIFERDYKDTAPPNNGLAREFSNKTKISMSHGKIRLDCDLCGIPFETYACWARRVNRHYCSRACASEGKITQVENICVICGDVFVTKKSIQDQNRKTTCSRECRQEKRRRFMLAGQSRAMLSVRMFPKADSGTCL